MPKKGFKSYILRDKMYDKLFNFYKENEIKYRTNGITSFSGFITLLMSESLEETRNNSNRIFEKIYFKDNKLVLKDNLQNRTIELEIKKNRLYCYQDKKYNCMHIGFAYSLAEISQILNKRD